MEPGPVYQLNKIVYFIVDQITGCRWAHNKWATPTSIPQIFGTKKAAAYQLSEEGKIGLTQKLFGDKAKYKRDPVIRVAYLSDNDMGIPYDYD